MRITTVAAAFALTAAPVLAEPVAYVLDSSHSQIVFTYDHLGFSTTTNMFSGFEGEISFDQENPANSSVTVSFPVTTLFTGWEERFADFMSPNFFNAAENEDVRFTSTSIEVTGEDTAQITGDLTMNGVTQPVVLDARLNKVGDHPMVGQPWAGFDATTTLIRSEWGLGMAAPFVGDEVSVYISIEAMAAQ